MAYSEYDPTSVSAPGETLKDVLEERGITPTQLGSQIGWSSEELDLVLDGKAPITIDFATKLEQVLGIPAKFWLAREAKYRKFRATTGEGKRK